MPSERELKRRLRSVQNIRQVTKAMQTVAASRMRRAQSAVLASRPYEERLRAVLNDLGPYADPEEHPLLARRPVRRVGIVLITSDRGLVGAMNVNLIRAALRFAQARPAAGWIGVGRKGIAAVRRLRVQAVAEFTGLGDRPTSTDTNVVARVAQEEYIAGRVDEVHLAFTRFVNTLRQVPTVRRILPLVPEEENIDIEGSLATRVLNSLDERATILFNGDQLMVRFVKGPDKGQAGVRVDGVALGTYDLYSAVPVTLDVPIRGPVAGRSHQVEVRVAGKNASSSGYNVALEYTVPEAQREFLDYIFEPDPVSVLGAVLPRLIEVSVYQAVLDGIASEQSARMVAMRNATDNASDLIEDLTLAGNKARQARITKEMLEIATGAEALAKG